MKGGGEAAPGGGDAYCQDLPAPLRGGRDPRHISPLSVRRLVCLCSTSALSRVPRASADPPFPLGGWQDITRPGRASSLSLAAPLPRGGSAPVPAGCSGREARRARPGRVTGSSRQWGTQAASVRAVPGSTAPLSLEPRPWQSVVLVAGGGEPRARWAAPGLRLAPLAPGVGICLLPRAHSLCEHMHRPVVPALFVPSSLSRSLFRRPSPHNTSLPSLPSQPSPLPS